MNARNVERRLFKLQQAAAYAHSIMGQPAGWNRTVRIYAAVELLERHVKDLRAEVGSTPKAAAREIAEKLA
jgi:hypothetical protein